MRIVRVHPRLRACLGFSFTIIGSLVTLLLLIDAAKGRLSWNQVGSGLKSVCLIAGGMGVFLYGIGWAFATTVNDEGLRGPNIWGLRRTISWNDIGSVRKVVAKGIPYLLIRSRSSKKQIWFCVLGFKEPAVLERLQAFITIEAASTPPRNSEEKSA